MKRCWLLLFLLTACGGATPTSTPTLPQATPTVAALAPTPTLVVPTLPEPTASLPSVPTMKDFRDARGVFTVALPENWDRRALPQGVGVIATAYNATARFTLSLLWSSEPITPTLQEEIANQVLQGYEESFLVQSPQLEATRPDAETYVVRGTATLTGTPTTIEISVRQLPQGTVVLQSWMAPTALWEDFDPLFKQPIEQSLTIDETAMLSLAQ